MAECNHMSSSPMAERSTTTPTDYLKVVMAPADGDAQPSLVQLCIRDHHSDGRIRGHIHVQAHTQTEDSSGFLSTDWSRLDCSLQSMVEAARRVNGGVRVHMHHDEPPTRPTPTALLDRLWSCSKEVTAAEAACLTLQRGEQCPICMEDMCEGDEVRWRCAALRLLPAPTLPRRPSCACSCSIPCCCSPRQVIFMPCNGEHVSHFPCLRKWLEKAPSCPTCRFELPTRIAHGAGAAASEEVIERLLNKSVTAMLELTLECMECSSEE